MIKIIFAIFLSERRLWIGPLVVAISASFLIAQVATYWWSLGTPSALATLETIGRSVDEVRASSYMLYVVIGVTVVAVLGTITSVTIRAQRYQIATLRVAGACPRQLRFAVTVQVVAISVLGSVVGYLLAMPWTQTVSDILLRMSTRSSVQITADSAVTPFALSTLCTVVVCWLSAYRPARIASQTPAVAAIRDQPRQGRRMGLARWIGASVAGLSAFMVAVGAATTTPQAKSTGEAFAVAASSSITLGIALVVFIGLAAPVIFPPIMRAWTSLVPMRGASWYLARRMALYRFSRSPTTIVPLAIGFTLFGVIFSSISTWQTALDAVGISDSLNSLDSYVILAPVAIITGIGSLMNLAMMGRGRERELALVRVAGASPRTIRLQAVCEAFIYVATSCIVALLATAVTVLVQSVANVSAGGPFSPRVELKQLAVLAPIAYLAMLAVVATPAFLSIHKDVRSSLASA